MITTSESPPSVLQVAELTKSYTQSQTVLDRINFSITPGTAVALLGSNGSGKSTLLRCCIGLEQTDSGYISLLGCDLKSANQRELRSTRTKVGFVAQHHHLVLRANALTNVLHARLGSNMRCLHHAFAPGSLRQAALDCLEAVELADFVFRRVRNLSGGEAQRVAIARALMQEPQLVVADEPTASLDPKTAEQVLELLKRLISERGKSLLFTTHRPEHALSFSDHILGLRGGKLVLDRPSSHCRQEDLEALYG